MKQVRIRNAISLAMNALIFVQVLGAVIWFFLREAADGASNMEVQGAACFIFFTVDSNVLAALTCLLIIPFNLRSIRRGKDAIPKWALTCKLIGTVAVALTFAVVMLFLGPTMGYDRMFVDASLPLHLICPLLAIGSFCFLERGLFVTKKRLLLTVIPTVIYGTVYMLNVIFLNHWWDFYGFNIGGFWYITYLLFPVFTYLLALGIRAVHNRFDKLPAKIGES